MASRHFESFRRTRAEGEFRALYRDVSPVINGLALRLAGGERSVADDVIQEAWLRVLVSGNRISDVPFTRWICGVVVNCWRERHRHDQRETAHSTDDLDLIAIHPAPVWPEAPLLARAIDTLAEGYRVVLVLHDVEGYTHAEIADLLGIEEGTSKSQLARARRRLRTLLSSPSATDQENPG